MRLVASASLVVWRASWPTPLLAAQCCARSTSQSAQIAATIPTTVRASGSATLRLHAVTAAAAAPPRSQHMTLTNSTRRAGSATSTTRRSRRRRCRRSARARSSRRRSSKPPCARAPSRAGAAAPFARRQRREEAAAAARRAHRQRAGRRARARARRPPRRGGVGGQGVAARRARGALASEPQTTERGGEGRLWAAYGSDEASAAGRRTALDAADRRARRRPRLVRGRRPRDAAEARRGGADLGDEAVAAHLGRLNAVVEALEKRLALGGLLQRTSGKAVSQRPSRPTTSPPMRRPSPTRRRLTRRPPRRLPGGRPGR